MYNLVANVFVTIICALTLLCVRLTKELTVFYIQLFVVLLTLYWTVTLPQAPPPLHSLHVFSVVLDW